MITGTIESKPVPTTFGLEYEVIYDLNPDAKCNSGQHSPGISAPREHYDIGDRVQLSYETGTSFGLWFIIGKV